MRPIAALIIVAMATPGFAQDGCANPKWKLEKEHSLLTSPSAAKTANGAEVAGLPATALMLNLAPSASAKMPMRPERAPKQPSAYAGYVRFTGAPKSQTVLVTLSAEAWIDMVQNEHNVKSAAFSSLYECATMRKSVRFELAPGPFAVQLSGVAAETINMTVTPAGE